MRTNPLLMIVSAMALSSPLAALGSLEYTETLQSQPGEAVDDLTPVLRTYLLPSDPRGLRASGPFELELTTGESAFLTLEAHPGLLYQTSVAFQEGILEILLEPGLTGPLEKGRLKVRVSAPHWEKILLRKGTVCSVVLDQEKSLSLELRDQVFFKADLRLSSLQALLSWKSEARISGKVEVLTWRIQGLSTLRLEDLQWQDLQVTAGETSRIWAGSPGRVTGVLRSRSALEIPEGADLTGLLLREESQIKLLNPRP